MRKEHELTKSTHIIAGDEFEGLEESSSRLAYSLNALGKAEDQSGQQNQDAKYKEHLLDPDVLDQNPADETAGCKPKTHKRTAENTLGSSTQPSRGIFVCIRDP